MSEVISWAEFRKLRQLKEGQLIKCPYCGDMHIVRVAAKDPHLLLYQCANELRLAGICGRNIVESKYGKVDLPADPKKALEQLMGGGTFPIALLITTPQGVFRGNFAYTWDTYYGSTVEQFIEHLVMYFRKALFEVLKQEHRYEDEAGK